MTEMDRRAQWKDQRTQEVLRDFLRKQLALTTVDSKSDRVGPTMLAHGLRQGQHELFKWGVGPSLEKGDLVGLYVPKRLPTRAHPDRCPLATGKGTVTHLYSVARKTHTEPSFPWRQIVWLQGHVSLTHPVELKDLKRDVLASRSNVDRYLQSLGHQEKPLECSEAKRFWTLVLKRNEPHIDRLVRRLLPEPLVSGVDYDVGLSYASEDIREAQHIVQTCMDHGIHTFYNETVMRHFPDRDVGWLREHFAAVFARDTRFNVALISRHYVQKCWTMFEFDVMRERARSSKRVQLFLVSMDETPVPHVSRGAAQIDFRTCGPYGVVQRLREKLEFASKLASYQHK